MGELLEFPAFPTQFVGDTCGLTDEDLANAVALASIDVSEFAFRHFVPTHDTIEANAQQCSLEMVNASDAARSMQVEKSRHIALLKAAKERAADENRSETARETARCGALDLERQLEGLDRYIHIRLRKVRLCAQWLVDNGVPDAEQFEKSEPGRWPRRVIRQGFEVFAERATGWGRGDVRALINLNIIPRDWFIGRATTNLKRAVERLSEPTSKRRRIASGLYRVAGLLGVEDSTDG